MHLSNHICCTNLSIFLQGTQHYNNSTVSLHYHLPEVTTGALHGVLSNNECILVFVALRYFSITNNLNKNLSVCNNDITLTLFKQS